MRLIHAKAVRPFVPGNKTDAADARAIWLAIQQPGSKFVGIKTEEQQATLVLHRQRELLMKIKAMQSNALRGLLYEFGAVFARGKNALFGEIAAALELLISKSSIPQYVADSLREQAQRIKALTEDTDLRTLLIHGAPSVLTPAKEPRPWLEQIKTRRPANVVIVAQAAKMARTIWAATARQQDYQRGHQSLRPQAA